MKKRSKRFETLEDIEQSLLRSSGGKKEKRILSGKTAASPPFSLAELWEEYGRLLVIPAICILLMLLILLCEAIAGSGTERPAAQTAAVTAEASGEESPAAEAAGESLPEETQVDPNKLAACEDPAINRLFDEYFTARLAADTDTLYRLFGRSGDASGQEELTSRLRAQASWIQSYDGISVYTMPGLADGDRVCIIRYKINFRRTNTNAPGIMYCYVQAQGDGSYRILENPDSETVKYINQKLEDPDVIAMQEEVNAELRSALSSDSDLALIYTSFLNGEIYNETAPDVNREQEVDLFLNPEDSDLVGGLVLEIDSETAPEQDSEATQEGAEAPEPGAETPAEALPEPDTETVAPEETAAPAETSPETGQEETIIQIG